MKKLQILGTGCQKCERLAANVEAAVKEKGLECEIEKVSNINDILKLGVMMTPALLVDGDVKIMGKVPSIEEIKGMIG